MNFTYLRNENDYHKFIKRLYEEKLCMSWMGKFDEIPFNNIEDWLAQPMFLRENILNDIENTLIGNLWFSINNELWNRLIASMYGLLERSLIDSL